MYRQLEKMTISATTGPGPWGQFQLPYKDGPTWKMIGSRAEHLSVFVCWFVALALLLCVLCAVDDVVCELLCCGCCGCPPLPPSYRLPALRSQAQRSWACHRVPTASWDEIT